MARTKQTWRRSMRQSHDDVAAAVVVASVPMTHALAPPTPALSGQRSRFALEWVSSTFGCHFFHVPVDWEGLGLDDYPAKIAYPMDLQTLKEYAETSSFCFATMLDRSRLIWANACLYNGDTHPVADVARRIAALFEAKIIELQQHPTDDTAATVACVMMPVMHALMAEKVVEPFVEPVDLMLYPSYPTVVDHGLCLSGVQSQLQKMLYLNRYDFASDVQRVFDNGIRFNGPQSVIGVGAKHARDTFDDVFAACVDDVDRRFLITDEMRMGLHENLYSLSDSNRRIVMQKMRDDKCLSSIRDGETTTLSINKMCMKEFLRVDTFVRHLLVNQSQVEGCDDSSDVESEGDEACDY